MSGALLQVAFICLGVIGGIVLIALGRLMLWLLGKIPEIDYPWSDGPGL